MLKQVLQVQLVMQELRKSRQRAEEARKKIANTENDEEQTAAAMAASRPAHFVTVSPVCQENVYQQSAFEVLRDSVMDVNLTDEETVYLQMGMPFGAADEAGNSAFGSVLLGVAPLCLYPPRTASLVAGS